MPILVRGPVEQHVLDADMVMKPFEMAQPRDRASDMQMQRRRTMPDRSIWNASQGSDLQKCGHTAAASHIGLLHVDRAPRASRGHMKSCRRIRPPQYPFRPGPAPESLAATQVVR